MSIIDSSAIGLPKCSSAGKHWFEHWKLQALPKKTSPNPRKAGQSWAAAGVGSAQKLEPWRQVPAPDQDKDQVKGYQFGDRMSDQAVRPVEK